MCRNGTWRRNRTNTGPLGVQAGGAFVLFGPNDTATIGNVDNSGGAGSGGGGIDLENGSTLTVTGNVKNSGDIYTSRVTGAGGNTVTISGTLTNNAGAHFFISPGRIGSSDVANVGVLVNSGFVYVEEVSTLNLTNQPDGITDVVAGSNFGIYGTFKAGSDNGFATLNMVEGGVQLGNRQGNNITPSGGVLTLSNTGGIDVEIPQTTVQINGDVSNFGRVSTSYHECCGGATLTVTGTLTNNPGAELNLGEAAGKAGNDVANVGTLVNNGTVIVWDAATLNLTNQPNGITDIVAGSEFDIYGTFTAGGNNAFANLTSVEGALDLQNGQTTTVTPAGGTFTIAPGGSVVTSNGTTLQVIGSMVNGGTLNNGGLITVGSSLSPLLAGLGTLQGPTNTYTQLANGTLGEIINPHPYRRVLPSHSRWR